MKTTEQKEVVLQGTPISEGIAIGSPFLLHAEETRLPVFPIPHSQITTEISRYRKALFSSRKELLQLQKALSKEGSEEAVTIIDTHIQMLDDPLITTNIEERISHSKFNIESVFHTVIKEYTQQFSLSANAFFKQRISDVHDLSNRILGHLQQTRQERFKHIPSESILIAKELAPSEIASSCTKKVLGFITEVSAGHSHASLIARAKGIPYVGNISFSEIQLNEVSQLIIDGNKGVVILNPTEERIQQYRELIQKQKEEEYHCSSSSTGYHLKDGKEVHLHVNITHHEEINFLELLPCRGVGLFRSEFLALENSEYLFSEEMQTLVYTKLIQKLNGKNCVVRLFDIGGDKLTDLPQYALEEPNPALGFRGIRFLLKHQDLLRTQLRAIVKASVYGAVKVLVPLVMDVKEIKATKEIFNEILAECAAEGIQPKNPIEIGAMIEVPSAALTMEELAKECDFFSIGTNDLVQYLLAIDRTNVGMEEFCLPIHPSVIKLLKLIVREASLARKPLSVCGEMASNLLFVPLFLGLGIEHLSCAPKSLSRIKGALSNLSTTALEKLIEEISNYSCSDQIIHALATFYETHLMEK